jgi:hypothetical protein
MSTAAESRSDYSSVRMELLESYYVVSEHAYDTSDPDERQNRRHLKQVLNDALQNNDQQDMLSALVYVLLGSTATCTFSRQLGQSY